MNNIHGTFIPVYKPTPFSRGAHKSSTTQMVLFQQRAKTILPTIFRSKRKYRRVESVDELRKQLPKSIFRPMFVRIFTPIKAQRRQKWFCANNMDDEIPPSQARGVKLMLQLHAFISFFFEVGYSSTFVGFHFDELQAKCSIES